MGWGVVNYALTYNGGGGDVGDDDDDDDDDDGGGDYDDDGDYDDVVVVVNGVFACLMKLASVCQDLTIVDGDDDDDDDDDAFLACFFSVSVDDYMAGKYALAWVLPKIVTQNPEPITRHVPELEAVMEPCGVTECVSLLQVFGMIAKSKPKVLEGHVAAFCNYLTVSTLVPLILAMFVDMATANPAVFIDHVTALKLLAEQQPVFIHQIVKIVGAVGTVSLPHAVRTMGYLVSLLSGLSDQASLVVILQEIKALGLIHHSLLADHMQEISRLSQSGSSSVRILVHQLKDDSKNSGQKEMRSVSSQTEGTVTIITVGNPAYPSNVVGVRQQQQQQQQQQQVSHSNRSSQLSLTPSSRTSIANSRSLSDRPPEPLRDGVQHFCEKHMDTIRKFISNGRHKRYVRLNFQCGIKGTNCLYGKQFFILNTKLPKTWIHLMFLAVQAQSASALSQQDLSVSSLKHCWDALYPEKGNSGYITLVTSSFPSAKDQDALLQELHGDRYFDVFEFNAPRKY
ncbi:MELT-like protein [Mya arenaria]|uniref:MELT-like protein n=1 Tax=Mya arenaria TaxID=6604 RepID=A0ABY7F1Z4_MYAAR|nr:MELT-like protein [Mya arenaria]